MWVKGNGTLIERIRAEKISPCEIFLTENSPNENISSK